jgi:hypothetical protein
MKNRWGWRETWQQSRQVLHRWTQILSVAFALPQLLAIYCKDQVENLLVLTPWRKKKQVTAGRVRLELEMILGNVRVRSWWNPTCRKFNPSTSEEIAPNQANRRNHQGYMMSKNKMADADPPPPTLWRYFQTLNFSKEGEPAQSGTCLYRRTERSPYATVQGCGYA